MTAVDDRTRTTRESSDSTRGRSLLWPSVGIALASRLGLFVLVYLEVPYLHRRHVEKSMLDAAAQVYHGPLGHLLNPWAHWDGVWYIRIASRGYARFPDSQAFFPLYPLTVRALGWVLGGAWQLAGIVVSVACFAALSLILYKLVAREFNERIALATVAFLSLFPTSFFFQAVYTESLFVLLVVLCFFFARRPWWPLAGVAGLLATLTHVSGTILVLPMALLYMRERGWRLCRIRADVASLLLVPAGLLIWMAYLRSAFGDALLFRHVEAHWGRSFAWPWVTVGRAVLAVYYDVKGMPLLPALQAHHPQRAEIYAATHAAHPVPLDALTVGNTMALAALVIALVVIAAGWRRLPAAYSLFALAVVALPLFGPTHLRPLMSMPRFILAAFPLFIVFALLTDKRPVLRFLLLAAFTVGLAIVTLRFAAFRWVA